MTQTLQTEVQTNVVFEHLLESNKRITVEQGGSRSGKTYNILHYLIYVARTSKVETVISIVRQTLPSIKKTVLRDFLEILDTTGLYDPSSLNKTDLIYKLNKTTFEFFSVDEPQKVRGGKRNILYINEANELSFEAWRQLIMRTTEKAIIDFNPSDEFHWIYDKVLTRDDAELYITTYQDNPFLPQDTITEIERLKNTDPVYWKIYGEGQRAVSDAVIYPSYQLVDTFPEDCEVAYGLDFGFNHPSVLIKVGFLDDNIFAQEMIYKSGMTTADLVLEMKALAIDPYAQIYCDHARPEAIEELQREGYYAVPANKAVYDGIMFMKGQNPNGEQKARTLYITKDSVETIREIRSYKWKQDRNEQRLDEPVKFRDDAMDALRYGAFTHYTLYGMGRVEEENLLRTF